MVGYSELDSTTPIQRYDHHKVPLVGLRNQTGIRQERFCACVSVHGFLIPTRSQLYSWSEIYISSDKSLPSNGSVTEVLILSCPNISGRNKSIIATEAAF